jgi:hypothetical protein
VIARIAATLGAALVLTGCSTEEGLRAQELLQNAELAQQRLTSSTFEGSMSFGIAGERIGMQFNGATAEDGGYFSMRANGIPGAGSFSMQMLLEGGRAWMDLGGGWRPVPAPQGLGPSGSFGTDAFQQLARHVKEVRVAEGQLVEGRSVTTIGGEIDTQGMLEAFGKLGAVAGELEGLSLDFSQLGIEFGDIEALLTIDEATGLLTTAFVAFSVEAEGREVDVELRYRLTSHNEPVQLPQPS